MVGFDEDHERVGMLLGEQVHVGGLVVEEQHRPAQQPDLPQGLALEGRAVGLVLGLHHQGGARSGDREPEPLQRLHRVGSVRLVAPDPVEQGVLLGRSAERVVPG